MINNRRVIIRILSLAIVSVVMYSCSNKLKHKDARRILSQTLYPHKITADFNLYVRYESKEEPSKWSEQQWKKNNDILEKAGLLKQTIKDSTIQFYVQAQARFENRHQYLYKAELNDKIKALIKTPELNSKTFDEYDFYNRHTGRKDWLRCEVTCGEMKLDTILNINQKKGPLDVYIDYQEKFYPTPFNEIANYGKKYKDGETYIKTITARKYPEEDWKLVY